ncbi:MAG: PH domain-containing protein [Candidatus Diapherotrites archaeon]|nr:PH domain-containing protein [Candidatus Diapherotrites archaeon]
MPEAQSSYPRYRPSLLALLPAFFFMFFFAAWISMIFLEILGSYVIVLFFLIWIGSLLLTYLNLINTWVEFREEGLFVQRGIIAKKRTTLLYSQIQDVSESQGLLEMILGLKALKIVTMTALSAAAGRLPSFDKNTAGTIRSETLKRISVTGVAQTQKTVSGKPKQANAFEPTEKMQKNIFPIQIGKVILSGLPFAAIILFFLIALSLAVNPFFVFLIGIFLFIAIISIIGIAIQLSATSYFIGNTRLEVQFQFLSFYKLNIPYEKIQDLVLIKSLFARIVGIADLRIETGAAEVYARGQQKALSSNTIPALFQEQAFQLRGMFAKAMGFSLKEAAPALVAKIPLEEKKPLKKTVSLLFFLGVGIAIICAVLAFNAPQFFASALFYGLILLVFLAILKFVYEIFYLKAYYYNLTEDCLLIRKGLFNIKEIIIPFSRIQNVFVDQDIFDRIFGLWDVHVSTVTPHSMMQGHIDGLSLQNARIISDMLLGKIKQSN